jgi:hypothetical protein
MTILSHVSRTCLPCCALLATAVGQQPPTPTRAVPSVGFSLPTLQGSLRYSLSASENLDFGYNGAGGVAAFSGVSGNVAYLSPSLTHPFSLVYSGGYLANTSGQPSQLFQNLAVSQEFDTRNWKFAVSDRVDYLPETPLVGLSGIPGVGDGGLLPIGTPVTGQGVLSRFSTRVDNDLQGNASRALTGSTSLVGFGRYALQRFVGANSDNGFDNNEDTASGGLVHRIDALNSVNARYTFTRLSYLTVPVTLTVQGIGVGYLRQWSPQLSTDVFVSPIRVSGAQVSGASIDVNANAALTYTGIRNSVLSLVYARSINNGAGTVPGVRTDAVSVNAQRRLSAAWGATASAGYVRTASLLAASIYSLNARGEVVNVQINRAINPSFSAYMSYTAQHQSTQGSAATPGLFSGLSQILGFGLTYAPGAKYFGRR